ncbi:hypothetical protein N431DRAFT_511868 [Stipitochalara longipes BDJ]|nr:hypothetical protein N431DRAFT_511868 [Stipitochalara longipes BDJ]
MKFSLIFLAALVGAVAARDYPCDDSREVGVCCTNESDIFEQCRSADRRDRGDDRSNDHDQNRNPPRDGPHYTYTCKDNEHAKCCDNHDNFKPRGVSDGPRSRRNCHDG